MNYDQQDQLTSTVPHPQQEIPPRLLSRRRVLAGLAGFAGLAALGGGFAFWRYQQSQTPVYRSRVQDEVIETVAWSPDGKRIATGGYTKDVLSESGVIRIWDALKGEHMVRSTDSAAEIFSLAWSPTSQFLASANHGENVVRVLSPTTGAALFTYPQEKGADFDQRAVVWSPDGKRIASGSTDKSVQIWKAETGEQTFFSSGQSDIIRSVAWSPDSRYIVSGSSDGTVQVWLP